MKASIVQLLPSLYVFIHLEPLEDSAFWDDQPLEHNPS